MASARVSGRAREALKPSFPRIGPDRVHTCHTPQELVVEQVNHVEAQATIVAGVGISDDDDPGTDIIVFVVQNNVTPRALNTALYLMRPGRDRLHLVAVVASEMQVQANCNGSMCWMLLVGQ